MHIAAKCAPPVLSVLTKVVHCLWVREECSLPGDGRTSRQNRSRSTVAERRHAERDRRRHVDGLCTSTQGSAPISEQRTRCESCHISSSVVVEKRGSLSTGAATRGCGRLGAGGGRRAAVGAILPVRVGENLRTCPASRASPRHKRYVNDCETGERPQESANGRTPGRRAAGVELGAQVISIGARRASDSSSFPRYLRVRRRNVTA